MCLAQDQSGAFIRVIAQVISTVTLARVIMGAVLHTAGYTTIESIRNGTLPVHLVYPGSVCYGN